MTRLFILLLTSLSTGLMCCGGEPRRASELDRSGGWKGRQFEATGFFRAEHDGERWWLVTPEGNAFLSLGINHYHPGWWAQDYNREHWVMEFGAERPWDQAWQKGFRNRAVADCRRLGFSTLGFHSETPMLIDPPLGPVMPYIRQYEPVPFSFWRRPKPEAYVDIFSPEFEDQCDAAARRLVQPYANDPVILGFAMADILILSDKESQWSKVTTWPRVLRNFGADAPGKGAYVSMMRECYRNVGAFNAAYGTNFSSWDALAAAQDWRPATSRETTEIRGARPNAADASVGGSGRLISGRVGPSTIEANSAPGPTILGATSSQCPPRWLLSTFHRGRPRNTIKRNSAV